MNNNQRFQLLWNKLLKGFYKRGINKNGGIQARFNLMKNQIEVAKNFGKIDLCIIGDSNAENLAVYSEMIKFSPIGLSINLAVSGTRADEWVDFFQTKNGLSIYKEIISSHILWNIGGNHILHKKMDILESSLKSLFELFPISFNCFVPPIWSKYLEYNQILIDTHQQVQLCNKYILEIWKDRAIDTFTPFMNWDRQEPFVLAHKDLVHFSELGNLVRVPLMILKIKSLHP